MLIKKEKGFSLAELGIAMVIMLIVSTIAVISYFAIIDNANEVKVVEDSKVLQQQLAREYASNDLAYVKYSDSVKVNYEEEIKPEVKEVLEHHFNQGTNLIGTVFTNDPIKENGEIIIGNLSMKKSVALEFLQNTFLPMTVNADTVGLEGLEIRKLDKDKVKELLQKNVSGDWYIIDRVRVSKGEDISEGENCPSNYSCIETTEELDGIRNNLEGNFMLMNDIDISTYGNWEPIRNFVGTFDGNGYVISNLTIDSTEDKVGFFGTVTDGVVIKNIGLEGINVVGHITVGGLVGYNDGATIENSYVEGIVEGSSIVGGLVGLNKGEIRNSYSLGTVAGINNIGGLIGKSFGLVENSYSSSNVYGRNSGGLVGGGESHNEIMNSYFNLNVDSIGDRNFEFGLTDTQMKQQASFEGWDFDTIWTIDEGVGFPTLR